MQTVYYVGSISHAMHAKRLLDKHGIRAYIRRAEADGRHGCGYGLLINGSFAAAQAILRTSGITLINPREREGV